MNELYELVGGLETEVTPLDQVALKRVTRLARRALPGRRRRRWLPVAVAAVLLLSACGYAVATGQFAKWFDGVTPQGMGQEAATDFFSGLGTVIDQTQTADGVAVTLHAALYDGKTLALSFSLEGTGLLRQAMAMAQSGESRLYPANQMDRLLQAFPDQSEAEIQNWLDTVGRQALSRQSWYRFDSETETATLLLFWDVALDAGENELTLHLEQLQESGGKLLLAGPFDFAFSVENRETALVRSGPVEVTAENGVTLTLTELTVRAFSMEVRYTTAETDRELLQEALDLGGVRVGEQVWNGSGGGSRMEELPGGGFTGACSAQGFPAAMDPAAVTAVEIGGTWVERSAFGGGE